MRRKDKGFTLIELLAVIVVLAIISLIATPIVLNIIKSARKGAAMRSAEGVLRAANLYYMESQLELFDGTISFNCNNKDCVSVNTDENGNPKKLTLEGNSGKGYVNISENGKVSFKLSRDGYCTYKYAGVSKINISNGNCDEISIIDDAVPPTITANGNPITTSNSIMIGYIIEENESGLKEVTCKYGTAEGTYDKDENVQASANACSIKNLTMGTYYYQVCATDYGMNSACIEGQATTSEVPTPIIEYKDKDGNNVVATETGYVKKDYMTVTFNNTNVEGASNYIKTNVDTNIILKNASTIKVCGSDTNPGECSETTTTTLSANTWYKLEGNLSTTVEFIKKGELVALTKDAGGHTNTNNGLSRHIIPLASQIEFDNTNINSTCENLECSLNELYEKVGS